jgi:hypothetical protein
MKKLLGALVVSAFLPCVAFAASWDNVALIDTMCAKKDAVKGAPGKHPTSCLLKCGDSGYGVQASDGKYLKLDDAGNKLALAELKKTSKKDDIRVNVTGEAKGDTIAVSQLKIVD